MTDDKTKSWAHNKGERDFEKCRASPRTRSRKSSTPVTILQKATRRSMGRAGITRRNSRTSETVLHQQIQDGCPLSRRLTAPQVCAAASSQGFRTMRINNGQRSS